MDWSGVDYLWMIVMFLSAVWTLILTAPIHCRGSTGEQVMECYISPNLFWWKKQTHLHPGWPEFFIEFFIFIVFVHFKQISFRVNNSFTLHLTPTLNLQMGCSGWDDDEWVVGGAKANIVTFNQLQLMKRCVPHHVTPEVFPFIDMMVLKSNTNEMTLSLGLWCPQKCVHHFSKITLALPVEQNDFHHCSSILRQ